MTTRAMGGPFAEQSPQQRSNLRSILDLGCGPGGWVLDIAYTLPDAEVAGVDISKSMVDYANARARSQNLLNASFEVMDITNPLAFADASFAWSMLAFSLPSFQKTNGRPSWPNARVSCVRSIKPIKKG